MALAQKLSLKQGQSLVMTPQLTQSIKLLAMSNIELSAFVEDEIERNPFLERDRSGSETPDDRRTIPDTASPGTGETIEDVTAHRDLETSAQSLSENLGTSIENVYPDEQDYRHADDKQPLPKDDLRLNTSGLAVSTNASAYDRTVADFAANSVSLRDTLLEQLSMAAIEPATAIIANDVIDNLDEAGYLVCDLDDIGARLGARPAQLHEALVLVQGFEPTGIAARDLRECLALQLREKNRLDPAMQIILDNLDLLGKRDFSSLGKLTNLTAEDLRDALEEIRLLDPKPGTAYDSVAVQHVAPDVFVKEAADGSWKIELNNQTLPKVLVNETYMTQVSSILQKANDKEFIGDCMQTASWLTKSLDQRAKTILKVATEIVRKQDAFLVEGVRHLRPLTLREIADEIDMHESSVSRVTSNKYMMTPRGLFELKYFFTTSISSNEGGEGHSSEAVRDRIRALIDAESVTKILSDDAIVDELKASGIDIARRTIAKYRDAMHIPSSVQRRREKKAALLVSS